MKRAGQIVLFRFPQTDLTTGKLRPALLVGRVPGPNDDWLACMISSQLRHYIEGFDEIIQDDDPDFIQSGLKVASVTGRGDWPSSQTRSSVDPLVRSIANV